MNFFKKLEQIKKLNPCPSNQSYPTSNNNKRSEKFLELQTYFGKEAIYSDAYRLDTLLKNIGLGDDSISSVIMSLFEVVDNAFSHNLGEIWEWFGARPLSILLAENFPKKEKLCFSFCVSGLSSGVAACLFAQNALTIGSSGSVFGLLGALLAYARKRKDMLGFLLWKQFSFLAFILILSGFLFSNVSNSGHIGGILGGFLFTYFVVLGNIPQKNTILKFLTFLFYGAIGWGTITVFLIFYSKYGLSSVILRTPNIFCE